MVTGGNRSFSGVAEREFQGPSRRRSCKRQWQDLLEQKVTVLYTPGGAESGQAIGQQLH